MGRFGVVGATSWGLTLAWLLTQNGHQVDIITRTGTEAASLNQARGLARLPGLTLPPEAAVFTAEPDWHGCDGVIVAVPAQSVRRTVSPLPEHPPPLLSAAKGIESGSLLRMTEVLATRWPRTSVAALSGPNLSHEVAAGLPAATVVASADPALVTQWQAALSGSTFRCYGSSDVVGVELAGALKNVIAIAAGAAWGLDLGANAVATVMTRGLAEITRLGVALGADAPTFRGLAGVGDLAVSCFSLLSRNRRLGERLARGEAPSQAAAAIGEAVEGMATATVAVELGRRVGVELPIATQVSAVLGGTQEVRRALAELMQRPLRSEHDEI